MSPPPGEDTSYIVVAVIVTRAHCCLAAPDHCYVMLGTVKFVDKSINEKSARRLDHCGVIASPGEVRSAHSEVELQTEFESFTAFHLGSNTNQLIDWAVGGTCIISSRSVYAPHLVQFLRMNLFKYVTLGFWLYHSPCSLVCWTNNTLPARS